MSIPIHATSPANALNPSVSTSRDEPVFLKNVWYVAAWDHELIDGAKLARTLLEKPVLIFRGESGKIVALEDRCCHRGAPLSMGRIEGDCVRCMYHGMKFDATGKCVQIPGQDIIPAKLGVRSFPIVERDHLVWIWMGDPALADVASVPDYAPLHDPAWRGMPGYMHYKANWLFIVDNLADFAHLAFVHTKTLGGSEEYAYKTKKINMERLADGFRVERWNMDSDAPPYHKKVIPDKTAKVDRRNIGEMRVPGMFFMETLFAPSGSGAENGNREGARQYRNCQFMTPETRRTTHFFWNYLHDFDLRDSNIALSTRNSLEEGFMEDKALIEAQQVAIDLDPDMPLMAIIADAPLVHFRRVFGQRLAAEQGHTESMAA